MGTFLENSLHFLSNQNLVSGRRQVCNSEMGGGGVESICYALIFFLSVN